MVALPQERMNQLEKHFEMIESEMANNPDAETYVKLASEYSELQHIVGLIRELNKARHEEADLETMLEDHSIDSEMRSLAEEELPEIKAKIAKLEHDVQIELLPKDAADEKSAILEIRAGTGGSEAALFAGDLFRMYERYASLHGWKVNMMSKSSYCRKMLLTKKVQFWKYVQVPAGRRLLFLQVIFFACMNVMRVCTVGKWKWFPQAKGMSEAIKKLSLLSQERACFRG